ncbi:MAG: RNA-binding protein [Ruminococcaceae bacterium]|nr:RNA-binding protein [Oscillospiraceae bacterium]
MNDLLGHLVVSLAGRDKDCVCAVVGISDDEGYVLIADGRIRKVESPKKKKLKHLKPIDCSPLSAEKLTNRFIREAVNEYKAMQETV